VLAAHSPISCGCFLAGRGESRTIYGGALGIKAVLRKSKQQWGLASQLEAVWTLGNSQKFTQASNDLGEKKKKQNAVK